ncbi:hypothetical protein EVAR_13554_1 [Eumeta japonica]|uniref:Uncharacterized protein n=1 Tax=Eumeta variegata TaxID=151549 RepID=A0A4C1U8L4_EUMVA|nr:hypothetical protein EVAR_13554_1 [Eumeta japonica]
MSSLLLFGLGSGLSGRRWRLRLPVRILSVQLVYIRQGFGENVTVLPGMDEASFFSVPFNFIDIYVAVSRRVPYHISYPHKRTPDLPKNTPALGRWMC